jgi:hypothetical protein
MNEPSLPLDDLPLVQTTQLDRITRRQLEQATGKCFYAACDRITQALLLSCEWYVTIDANAPILVIACPDVETYWHVVSDIAQIGRKFEQFASEAKLRIYPPIGKGRPFEIGLDELSA